MLATKGLTFQEVLDLPLRDVLSSAGAARQEEPVRAKSTSKIKIKRPATLFIVTRFMDDKDDVTTTSRSKNALPNILDPIVFLSKREAVSNANHYDALLIEVQWDKSENQYARGTILRFPTWLNRKSKANRKPQKTKAQAKAKVKKTRAR